MKPPGGGSSICFGDDPVPVTKKSPAKPVAEEPAPSSPEVTEAAPESTPSTEDAPAEAATSAPTNGTSEEKSSEQTPVETPAPESKPEQISNGTTENGSVSYSRSNSVAAAAGSDVDFPAVTFEAEGGPAEAAAPSQPSQNGHAKETASNDSPAAVNGSSNDSIVAAKQNGEVSSPKASLNGHSNGTSESSPAPALQNGSKSEGTNTEVSPASEQITKKPPTPVRSNSKGEFFENPSETKQQQQHVARTMPSNHHMKSSIFIEEETHNFIAPPRKSGKRTPYHGVLVSKHVAPLFSSSCTTTTLGIMRIH